MRLIPTDPQFNALFDSMHSVSVSLPELETFYLLGVSTAGAVEDLIAWGVSPRHIDGILASSGISLAELLEILPAISSMRLRFQSLGFDLSAALQHVFTSGAPLL